MYSYNVQLPVHCTALCVSRQLVKYYGKYYVMFPGAVVDPRKVLIVAGHHNWIVVAYAHFVICYR